MRALRWLGGRRAVLPITARVICARTVREWPLFFLRELVRRRGVYIYSLRGSGVRVAIRHVGVDAATLAEVFYHGYYETPGDVAAAIGEPAEVLDLGANIGLFGAFAVARWPSSRILAYEPDPANAATHERTIAANRFGPRWRLLRAAAGAHDGEVRFAAGLEVGSHVADHDEVPGAATITASMRDVLPQISAADLVKMDIEGGEWEILHDPRFARHPPRALVLEYHPRGCADPDPRAAVEQVLERAGLRTASIMHRDDGHGMLWAWRSGSEPL